MQPLYLIEILHQTTTVHDRGKRNIRLYLIEILHQTTTRLLLLCLVFPLYLIEILHQTTTVDIGSIAFTCCILSKFYIKPQLRDHHSDLLLVVSYRNSTSNHNSKCLIFSLSVVVSYRNSTSNHNCS